MIGAVAGLLVLAGVVAVVSHIDGSQPAADPTQVTQVDKSSGGSTRPVQGATALWHDLAQCLRDHGYALADPAVSATGVATWSGGSSGAVRFKNAMRAVGFKLCGAQIDALPAQALNPPPTPAELHNLVRFAQCMRSHGISDWPDPHADGTFPLSTRLQALGKRGIMSQLRACAKYDADRGIAISPGLIPAGPNLKAGGANG